MFGGPANTTYGENTGVLALSRIYDPRVIRIAAVLAMLFSFSPKFAAVISSMPGGTIGGVSLENIRSLYDEGFRSFAMISAIVGQKDIKGAVEKIRQTLGR